MIWAVLLNLSLIKLNSGLFCNLKFHGNTTGCPNHQTDIKIWKNVDHLSRNLIDTGVRWDAVAKQNWFPLYIFGFPLCLQKVIATEIKGLKVWQGHGRWKQGYMGIDANSLAFRF